MTIAMVSLYTNKYKKLQELTWDKNKKLYCEKYNYKAYLLDTNTATVDPNNNYIYDKLGYLDPETYGVSYIKVVGLQKIMHDNPDHEWLMWCDGDTLITNFNIKIESFLDDNYHFISGTAFNGICAGVFCIRNSDLGRKYINTMVYYKNHFMHEQDFMIKTYDMFKDIIKLASPKTFNSLCFSEGIHTDIYSFENKDNLILEGQWTPEDFLMHWPGASIEKKIELAKKYLEQVIL